MKPPMKSLMLWRSPRLLLLLGAVILLAILGKSLHVEAQLLRLVAWVQSLGLLAPLAFIVLYNLATVLFIPGFLLTLSGGVLFGMVWGSLYVFVAATLGATLAFMIGRYVSRDWVAAQIANYPKFQAIDRAVAQNGFKIVLLTRLSPLFPFNLLNYAFGITQVSLQDYVLGSVGMIPGTVLYVYLGSLAGSLATLGNPSLSTTTDLPLFWVWTLRLVGFAATIAVTVFATHIARQALAEAIDHPQIAPEIVPEIPPEITAIAPLTHPHPPTHPYPPTHPAPGSPLADHHEPLS